jgi:hypothetical protein
LFNAKHIGSSWDSFGFVGSHVNDNSHLKLPGKEYSKGDSRYAARDAGIVTVEGLTAVLEGPASLLAV